MAQWFPTANRNIITNETQDIDLEHTVHMLQC